jgi:capsular exopolysaccharide synthesis family protein
MTHNGNNQDNNGRMSENDSPSNLRKGFEPSGEAEISIEEIFKIIRRRRFGIVFAVVACLTLSLIYFGMQTPEYRAVSVMMISDAEDPTDLFASVIGTQTLSDNKAVKKDVELLKSMPIAELTIRELMRSSRRDSLEFFGQRRYFSPIASLVKPLVTLFSWQPQLEKNDPDEVFRREALKLNRRIRVETVRETNVLKVSVSSPFSDESAFLTNTLCRVYKEADILRNSEKYAQANDFIADMLSDQQQKVTQADNALSDYMEANEIYEVSGNTEQLLEKLVEADAKYKSLLAEYNIAQNNLGFLDKKLSEAERSLGSRIARNVNDQLGAIQDEIRSSESAYIALMREKGPDADAVKAQKQELDIVKTRYEQLSRSKIAGEIRYAGQAKKYSFDLIAEKLQIERKLNELNFSAREFSRLTQYYENLLSRLPEKQQDYAKLQRDREVVSKTYLFLKEKLDETRILQGSEVGGVMVVGSAFRPFKPESPDLKKNILVGLVLGGLFAFVYAYGAEIVDDTVKDESFFRDVGLTMLSVVPLVTRDSNNGASDGESLLNRIRYNTSRTFREKLLAAGISRKGRGGGSPPDEVPMPKITDSLASPFAESFRKLRNSLDYSRIENPLQSILVSGTAMSEGKSTVCANLGMAFALVGKKTLIIDCDLRRASQHNKFNCKRAPGLTDYLFSQHHVIDENFFQPTHMDNLFLLSAGQKVPNPNELLGSGKMLDLIKALHGQFDKVLLDCPPLFLSDAAQLARSVDGILLVARLQHTGRKPLQDFMDDQFLRPKTLGIAVIASRDSERYGYGKYGYAEYSYGLDEDNA